MSIHFVTDQIVFLEQIDSTNDFLKKLVKEQQVKEPFCVYTNFQTNGKGQRQNTWQSKKGENLLVSFLVDSIKEIRLLPHLNKCIALGIIEILKSLEIRDVSIKWPNDIYVGDQKIAGILIENVIEGKHIKHCVLGVGLNVNQTEFNGLSATSLKQILRKESSNEGLLQILFDHFYKLIHLNEFEISERVNKFVYRKGKRVTFQREDGIKEYIVDTICNNGNLGVMDGNQFIELEHHRVKWIK
ncbi:MAG: biotin--[acetyl-CoA-carboxylase] ligase [Bacteroidia bacterium]|nr:biotin--[acetyl-CoA-carboxylase] ligase [Bacteroidia bacterium]